ncbi:unnamed protein product, partial [Didymodactylos carnosus]
MVELEFIKGKIITDDNPEYDRSYLIASAIKILKVSLKADDIEAIKRKVIEIAQDSILLSKNQTGIGYEVDVAVGTNHHVFSILGPHTGWYYGDVVIVFKPEIMLHPDTNFTIQAATFFPRGAAYELRPWLKDP